MKTFEDTSWSCTGSAILKVLPQKEGKVAHEKKVNHMFHSKENDWGFSHFMSFDV
jgi:ubiquitin carboxyl-terminal hydrolase 7